MDALMSDYRSEALKLILFAEKTEWAAKHDKSRTSNEVSTSDELHQLDSYNRKFEDSKTANSDTNELNKVEEEKELKEHEKYCQLLKANDSEGKNDALQDDDNPESEESTKEVDDIRNTEKHITLKNKSDVKLKKRSKERPKSIIGFKSNEPLKDSSKESGNGSYTGFGKTDLIKSAQNNTNLVTTLLGGYDVYPLPTATPLPYSDPTHYLPLHERSVPGEMLLSLTQNPNTNDVGRTSARLNPQLFGSLVPPYSIPTEQASNYGIHYQPGAPSAVQNWQIFPQISPAQSASPPFYYNQWRDEHVHNPLTPTVRNRTLLGDKQGPRAVKPKEGKKPRAYEQARINGLNGPKALERKAKPKAKVIKKKPKALKRMDDIAKKYNL